MKNNRWDTMFTGANGRISSKRVLGTFILLVLLTVIIICIFTGYEGAWLGDAVLTLIIGAFALLGIGVFEKRFKTPLQCDDNTVQEDNSDPGIQEYNCNAGITDESQQST